MKNSSHFRTSEYAKFQIDVKKRCFSSKQMKFGFQLT